MADDIYKKMQEDPSFNLDLEILDLIKIDILSASLKYEMSLNNNIPNDELYDFDLNLYILKKMEFSEKEINEDISLWYYFQRKKIIEEIHVKGERMKIESILERVNSLYYELKKQKKSE